MSTKKPSYDELERRCREAEELLEAIRSGRTDTVKGTHGDLVVRLAEAERREAHIKQVLLAIRNVNQLIVQETEPARLAEAACTTLTETLGYLGCWCAFLDDTGESANIVAHSGFPGSFGELRKRLARGDFPRCMQGALIETTAIVVTGSAAACPDCPLSGRYPDSAVLVQRLAHEDKVYGVLAVTVPEAFAHDEEEHALLDELAGDLAFALKRHEDAEALAESRRRYRELFEGSRDGFVMVDTGGRIIEANHAYCQMLGYSLDELRAMEDFYEITPERWRQWEAEEIWRKRLLKTGYTGVYEKEYIRKNGEIFPVELQAYTVFGDEGQPEYLWGVARDISERKRESEALRRSQAMLARTESAAHVGGWEWEIEPDEVTWSDELFRIFERDPGQGAPSFREHGQLYTPDDTERLREAVLLAVEKGIPYELQLHALRASGEVRICIARGYPETDETGKVSRLYGSLQDVTEQRRVEEAYSRFCTMATEMICVADLTTATFLQVNPAFERILGYTESDLLERPFSDFIHPDDVQPTLAAIEEKLSRGEPVISFENRYRCKDGSYRHLVWNSHPIRDEGRTYAIAYDVTERKHAEEALRMEVLWREAAVKAGRIGLWDWNLLTDNVVYSAEWKRQIGYEEHEIGTGFEEWQSRVHPDDLGPALKRVQDAIRQGQRQYGLEFRFRHKNGSYLWIMVQAALVFDDAGTPVRVLGSHVDITAQKQVEAALRESEARYRDMFENNLAVKLIVEPHSGRIVEANSAACDFYQCSRDQLTSMLIFDINMLPEAETRACMARAQSGKQNQFEFQHRLASGEVRDVQVHSGPVKTGGKTLLYSIVVDITERKQAERALRESEERYRRLTETARDIIVLHDMEGRILYVNKAGMRFYGFDEADIVGRTVTEFIPPEYHAPLRERQLRRARGETVPFLYELEFINTDGEHVPIEASSVLLDEDGVPSRVLIVARDISERKRVEAERERLLMAIEQSGEVIVITDPDARIQYVNPAFERVTGYSREEVLDENPRILKSGEQDSAFYEEMWAALTRGEPWQGRLINKRKDGALYTENASISPVCNASGAIVNYVAVKRDITHELERDEQYRQAQKMEAIGQLTGGVAHDFNNMLQVINGSAEMAMADTDAAHPAYDSLEEIAKAGKRASRLVGQLLAFSRRQIIKPEPLDLNEVLSGLLSMLDRVIGEHIRIDFVPGHDLGTVRADRGMVEQVLMNLSVNAHDAMPGGGRLSIETDQVRPDLKLPEFAGETAQRPYARISVRDTGCGMDAETLSKAFEPFFTTKEFGRGSGLGLATVYGIVKQHGGTVRADSEPGKGTCVEVYLPVVEEAPAHLVETGTAPARGGSETILLAEDEPMVRKLGRTALERAGYTVVAAADGLQALDLYREHASEIDLLILDVIMPDMGGKELLQKIQETRPDIPVLFASGYSQAAIHTGFVLDRDLQFIQKPFTRDELLRKVREVLDAENLSG